MTQDVFRIVYCSQTTLNGLIGSDEVDRILNTSRRNNARDGVTGALLVNGNFFVQALEGPFDAVQTVFERIQADPRHDNVVVLETGSVASRAFADWDMACAEPDDPAHVRAVLSAALVDPGPATSDLLDLLSHVVHHIPA